MPTFNQDQKEAIKKATELLSEKIKSNDKQDGVMVSNERIQKFVQEKQGIDEFAADKNPLIKEYINLHKEAAKLCENEADKKAFLDAIEELNHSPEMAAYEKYVEGLKFLAGMVDEPKKEVVDFFAMVLQDLDNISDEMTDKLFNAYVGLAETTTNYMLIKSVVPSTTRGEKRLAFAKNLQKFADNTLEKLCLTFRKEEEQLQEEKMHVVLRHWEWVHKRLVWQFLTKKMTRI